MKIQKQNAIDEDQVPWDIANQVRVSLVPLRQQWQRTGQKAKEAKSDGCQRGKGNGHGCKRGSGQQRQMGAKWEPL